jgi:hypothetical protein
MSISKKTTTQQAPTKSANPQTDRSTDPDFDEVLEGLSDSIAWFLSRPASLYKWMTAPQGGQRIILSLLTLYWWAVSAEAYWQALGEGQNFIQKGTAIKHEPFVPKPFSPNSAIHLSMSLPSSHWQFWEFKPTCNGARSRSGKPNEITSR